MVLLLVEVLDEDNGRVLVVDVVVVVDNLDALVDRVVPVGDTGLGSSQAAHPDSSYVVVVHLDVVDMDAHLDIDFFKVENYSLKKILRNL